MSSTTLAPVVTQLPADLHYVDDRQPGLSRRKTTSGFHYYDGAGQRVHDGNEIARIDALAIPPAYTEVWICADPNGHLQATGRDARGRKQYRYHPRWRAERDSNKYARMLAFGQALPTLRAALKRHLALRTHCRERVMATVITLLDETLIRVGNSRYARDNQSYGLTTLRTRHVEVTGTGIRFRFRGKSGVEHAVNVQDPRLARIVRRCLELPGQHLFQFLDAEGEHHPVTSTDVNAYLRELTGADFTAKDYRTWAGSVLALGELRALDWQPESAAKKHLTAMIKTVAVQLRNTPAVCRKCYIHPMLFDAFLAGELKTLRRAAARKGLDGDESLLMRFLERLPADRPH
jgi:DNA topoisomerase-1